MTLGKFKFLSFLPFFETPWLFGKLSSQVRVFGFSGDKELREASRISGYIQKFDPRKSDPRKSQVLNYDPRKNKDLNFSTTFKNLKIPTAF